MVAHEERACERCGARFTPKKFGGRYKGRFCSVPCMHVPHMRDCARCGVSFRVEPSRLHEKKFCSMTCTRTRISCVCVVCGATYEETESRRGRTRTCSKICKYTHLSLARPAAPPVADGVCQIPLGGGRYALVDEADFEALNRYRWRAHDGGHTHYAVRLAKVGGHAVSVRMHRVLLDAPNDVEVDHRNRNGLDNRRENLRLATDAQNAQNCVRPRGASGFRGVRPAGRRWVARIHVRGGTMILGRFADPLAAAHACDRAAREFHGAFARLNFPGPGELAA